MTSLLLFVIGLAALTAGAELVVRRGSRLAARLGISPIVIGLTLVSIGTSAPELAIGVTAAWHSNGALAVGNVAGSNIANILLIVGAAAVISPLPMEIRTLRFDLPVMAAASVVLVFMAWNGVLTRIEGLILLISAIVYTAVIVRSAQRENKAAKAKYAREYGQPQEAPSWRGVAVDLAAVGVGITVIVLGSEWLVQGAIGLARTLGVSDAFIGLTAVAVGTSMPELVTAVVATLRNERDLAVGNVLGSCIYNIFLILGATSLVPSAGVAVSEDLIGVDIPLMAAVALASVPVFLKGRGISRLEGVIFLAAYASYLGYLLLARA